MTTNVLLHELQDVIEKSGFLPSSGSDQVDGWNSGGIAKALLDHFEITRPDTLTEIAEDVTKIDMGTSKRRARAALRAARARIAYRESKKKGL